VAPFPAYFAYFASFTLIVHADRIFRFLIAVAGVHASLAARLASVPTDTPAEARHAAIAEQVWAQKHLPPTSLWL